MTQNKSYNAVLYNQLTPNKADFPTYVCRTHFYNMKMKVKMKVMSHKPTMNMINQTITFLNQPNQCVVKDQNPINGINYALTNTK